MMHGSANIKFYFTRIHAALMILSVTQTTQRLETACDDSNKLDRMWKEAAQT
jgi:hypothetical protein